MKKDFKTAVEDVKMHSDVVDIIGSYIPLKRAGRTFKCCCPFHKEKTPSFNVNPDRQIYHCFGCGSGGDVIRFVQEYEKVDFMTALRLLAEKSGITLDFDREAQGDGPSKKRLYEIHEFAANFYHRQLLESADGKSGRDYLAGRELSPEIVKSFLVGYIPEGWNALRQGVFDLIITDIDMPRLNGIDLVGMIKQDPRTQATPVIIVSYKDREEDRMRGLEAGADYYLTKSSFHDETLLDAVQDLIGEADT